MVDYGQLIDAETWAFIRETERWYPADSFEKPITEQRRVYNAMCRAFNNGRPDGVSAKDVANDGVGMRIYRANGALPGVSVLYSHGGSYSLGGLESHDEVCADICKATGFEVMAVDYRLLPENRREDALHDVQSAFDWVCKSRGHKIILVGDSAGGFLSASIAHANRRNAKLVGQVLIYPGLSDPRDCASMNLHANARLLTKSEVMGLRRYLESGAEPETSGFVIPLCDNDFADLPPTVAISAQCDPISDDGKDYVAAIDQADGDAI